jgi:hypothetical protein
MLGEALGSPITFNLRDPNAVLYARAQAARLVTLIDEPTRETIRVIIAVAHARGLTVKQAAAAVREVVGLPSTWAAAPMNLGRELREGTFTSSRRLSAVDKARIAKRLRNGTVTEEFIEEMQGRYAKSLIRLRSLTIARTETADAAMHGLRTSWKQAVQAGHLPADVRRYWIVTLDDRLRPEHAAVPGMNPEGVPLDRPFSTPLGFAMGPPLEPNCRCGEGLLVGGSIL